MTRLKRRGGKQTRELKPREKERERERVGDIGSELGKGEKAEAGSCLRGGRESWWVF